MGRVLVSFVITVVVDQDEEAGIDLYQKYTTILSEMENTAAKNFDVFDTTFDVEDY